MEYSSDFVVPSFGEVAFAEVDEIYEISFFLIGEQSHSDTVIQVGEEARTDVVLHVEFNAFINACTFEYVSESTLVVHDESRETGLQVDFLPAVHVIVLAGSPFHPNARCETVILRPYVGL